MSSLSRPFAVDSVYFVRSFDPDALYLSAGTSINLMAGIMQGAFYDPAWPEALNYGSFGEIIGHELTHGFDTIGRQYDASGNVREWWDDQTRERFDERARCFLDQYQNVTVRINRTRVLSVDGELTLGENIADNGGSRAAYFALMELLRERESRRVAKSEQRSRNRPLGGRRQREVDIKGMELYSDEQMFFMGLASVRSEGLLVIDGGYRVLNVVQKLCVRQTPGEEESRVLTDSHAPNSARVNLVLANMEEFSTAFGCPPGSPMNPVKRCRVW